MNKHKGYVPSLNGEKCLACGHKWLLLINGSKIKYQCSYCRARHQFIGVSARNYQAGDRACGKHIVRWVKIPSPVFSPV